MPADDQEKHATKGNSGGLNNKQEHKESSLNNEVYKH